ncbi:MAG TPA: hypothetical protein VI485_28795 [Vicinamibacterales bacterium]|nr:hypothetical protein [Vicinamibacterales bacterium]
MSDEQHAINERIASHLPTHAWQSTVPVVVADRPKVHQIGSATLYQLAGVHFIVTAGHLVEAAVEQGKTIGIATGAGNSLVSLDGGGWVKADHEAYDLAVHRLNDERLAQLSHMRFLRLSDITSDEPGPTAVYTICGYPAIWSESSTEERTGWVKPLELTTYAYDGPPLAGYSEPHHLLLSCDSEELSDLDGTPMEVRDKHHQPVRLPIGLRGVSGCSVWHIGDLAVDIERWPPARVAGIQNRAYQASGAVRATRWAAVNTLISKAFPELRPVLQLWLR